MWNYWMVVLKKLVAVGYLWDWVGTLQHHVDRFTYPDGEVGGTVTANGFFSADWGYNNKSTDHKHFTKDELGPLLAYGNFTAPTLKTAPHDGSALITQNGDGSLDFTRSLDAQRVRPARYLGAGKAARANQVDPQIDRMLGTIAAFHIQELGQMGNPVENGSEKFPDIFNFNPSDNGALSYSSSGTDQNPRPKAGWKVQILDNGNPVDKLTFRQNRLGNQQVNRFQVEISKEGVAPRRLWVTHAANAADHNPVVVTDVESVASLHSLFECAGTTLTHCSAGVQRSAQMTLAENLHHRLKEAGKLEPRDINEAIFEIRQGRGVSFDYRISGKQPSVFIREALNIAIATYRYHLAAQDGSERTFTLDIPARPLRAAPPLPAEEDDGEAFPAIPVAFDPLFSEVVGGAVVGAGADDFDALPLPPLPEQRVSGSSDEVGATTLPSHLLSAPRSRPQSGGSGANVDPGAEEDAAAHLLPDNAADLGGFDEFPLPPAPEGDEVHGYLPAPPRRDAAILDGVAAEELGAVAPRPQSGLSGADEEAPFDASETSRATRSVSPGPAALPPAGLQSPPKSALSGADEAVLPGSFGAAPAAAAANGDPGDVDRIAELLTSTVLGFNATASAAPQLQHPVSAMLANVAARMAEASPAGGASSSAKALTYSQLTASATPAKPAIRIFKRGAAADVRVVSLYALSSDEAKLAGEVVEFIKSVFSKDVGVRSRSEFLTTLYARIMYKIRARSETPESIKSYFQNTVAEDRATLNQTVRTLNKFVELLALYAFSLDGNASKNGPLQGLDAGLVKVTASNTNFKDIKAAILKDVLHIELMVDPGLEAGSPPAYVVTERDGGNQLRLSWNGSKAVQLIRPGAYGFRPVPVQATDFMGGAPAARLPTSTSGAVGRALHFDELDGETGSLGEDERPTGFGGRNALAAFEEVGEFDPSPTGFGRPHFQPFPTANEAAATSARPAGNRQLTRVRELRIARTESVASAAPSADVSKEAFDSVYGALEALRARELDWRGATELVASISDSRILKPAQVTTFLNIIERYFAYLATHETPRVAGESQTKELDLKYGAMVAAIYGDVTNFQIADANEIQTLVEQFTRVLGVFKILAHSVEGANRGILSRTAKLCAELRGMAFVTPDSSPDSSDEEGEDAPVQNRFFMMFMALKSPFDFISGGRDINGDSLGANRQPTLNEIARSLVSGFMASEYNKGEGSATPCLAFKIFKLVPSTVAGEKDVPEKSYLEISEINIDEDGKAKVTVYEFEEPEDWGSSDEDEAPEASRASGGEATERRRTGTVSRPALRAKPLTGGEVEWVANSAADWVYLNSAGKVPSGVPAIWAGNGPRVSEVARFIASAAKGTGGDGINEVVYPIIEALSLEGKFLAPKIGKILEARQHGLKAVLEVVFSTIFKDALTGGEPTNLLGQLIRHGSVPSEDGRTVFRADVIVQIIQMLTIFGACELIRLMGREPGHTVQRILCSAANSTTFEEMCKGVALNVFGLHLLGTGDASDPIRLVDIRSRGILETIVFSNAEGSGADAEVRIVAGFTASQQLSEERFGALMTGSPLRAAAPAMVPVSSDSAASSASSTRKPVRKVLVQPMRKGDEPADDSLPPAAATTTTASRSVAPAVMPKKGRAGNGLQLPPPPPPPPTVADGFQVLASRPFDSSVPIMPHPGSRTAAHPTRTLGASAATRPAAPPSGRIAVRPRLPEPAFRRADFSQRAGYYLPHVLTATARYNARGFNDAIVQLAPQINQLASEVLSGLDRDLKTPKGEPVITREVHRVLADMRGREGQCSAADAAILNEALTRLEIHLMWEMGRALGQDTLDGIVGNVRPDNAAGISLLRDRLVLMFLRNLVTYVNESGKAPATSPRHQEKRDRETARQLSKACMGISLAETADLVTLRNPAAYKILREQADVELGRQGGDHA